MDEAAMESLSGRFTTPSGAKAQAVFARCCGAQSLPPPLPLLPPPVPRRAMSLIAAADIAYRRGGAWKPIGDHDQAIFVSSCGGKADSFLRAADEIAVKRGRCTKASRENDQAVLARC